MDYKSLVEQFQINKGDRVWLSSELIKLVLRFKKEGIKFDGSVLIDTFQEAVGTEGTLMIPVFSFEFSNKGRYDVLNTKGTTGALGNIALGRADFCRTQHPTAQCIHLWYGEKKRKNLSEWIIRTLLV